MHNNQVEKFANEAIFVLQFNTNDAIRYVRRNAGVGRGVAEQAIKSTVTFHKPPKQECVTD